MIIPETFIHISETAKKWIETENELLLCPISFQPVYFQIENTQFPFQIIVLSSSGIPT